MSGTDILSIAISVTVIFGIIPTLIVLWAKRHFARAARADEIEHYQALNQLYPHLFDKEIQGLREKE